MFTQKQRETHTMTFLSDMRLLLGDEFEGELQFNLDAALGCTSPMDKCFNCENRIVVFEGELVEIGVP